MTCVAAVGAAQPTPPAESVTTPPAESVTAPGRVPEVAASRTQPFDAQSDTEGSGATLRLGARVVGQNNGSGLELDGRYGFSSGVQLGVLGALGYAHRSYISGQAVDDVVLTRGALMLLVPTTADGPARLFLRFVHGATVLSTESADAVRQTNEIGAFAHLSLGARSLLRAGVVLGADLEVSPTVELADQYQGLSAGYGYAVSRGVLVYADVAAGSTFGFNGDNGKVYYGGSLGVRLYLGKENARGAF